MGLARALCCPPGLPQLWVAVAAGTAGPHAPARPWRRRASRTPPAPACVSMTIRNACQGPWVAVLPWAFSETESRCVGRFSHRTPKPTWTTPHGGGAGGWGPGPAPCSRPRRARRSDRLLSVVRRLPFRTPPKGLECGNRPNGRPHVTGGLWVLEMSHLLVGALWPPRSRRPQAQCSPKVQCSPQAQCSPQLLPAPRLHRPLLFSARSSAVPKPDRTLSPPDSF